jgi:hypothetical protein
MTHRSSFLKASLLLATFGAVPARAECPAALTAFAQQALIFLGYGVAGQTANSLKHAIEIKPADTILANVDQETLKKWFAATVLKAGLKQTFLKATDSFTPQEHHALGLLGYTLVPSAFNIAHTIQRLQHHPDAGLPAIATGVTLAVARRTAQSAVEKQLRHFVSSTLNVVLVEAIFEYLSHLSMDALLSQYETTDAVGAAKLTSKAICEAHKSYRAYAEYQENYLKEKEDTKRSTSEEKPAEKAAEPAPQESNPSTSTGSTPAPVTA